VSDEEREYLNETIRNLNNQLVDALRERDEARRELFDLYVNGQDKTDTPRTNAAEQRAYREDGMQSRFVVHVEFARQMEREIARLTTERDTARQEVCFLLSRNATQGCDGDTPEFHATARGWCYLLEEDGK
jgi:hypothetical protein